MNLLADAAKLHHGKAGFLLQAADIRLQRAGLADAVTEDITPGLLRLRREFAPVFLTQK